MSARAERVKQPKARKPGAPKKTHTKQAAHKGNGADAAPPSAPRLAIDAYGAHALTVLQVDARYSKHIHIDEAGGMKKRSRADIAFAAARVVEVRSLAALADLLAEVCGSPEHVIIAGVPNAAYAAEQFAIVPLAELARLKGLDPERDRARLAGMHDMSNGLRMMARIKENFSASCWWPLDLDNPPGIPGEWAAMDYRARVQACEAFIPGIAAAGFVSVPSSSARVRVPGGAASNGRHVWFAAKHPADMERFRVAVYLRAQASEWTFKMPTTHRSGPDAGKPTGRHVPRSLFDWSTLSRERIVYSNAPTLGEGLEALPLEIEQRDGPALDSSLVATPEPALLRAIEAKHGARYQVQESGGALLLADETTLTRDTVIELAGGEELSVGEWMERASVGEKARCQAPFRESSSMAAFVRRTELGCILYDSIGITYRLDLKADEVAEAERFAEVLRAAGIGAAGQGQAGTTYNEQEQGAALHPLVAALRAWKPRESVAAMLDVPAPRWYVENLIEQGKACGIVSQGGTGKTTLLIWLGIATAIGGEWLGNKVAEGSFALLSLDDSQADLDAALAYMVRDAKLSGDEQEKVRLRVRLISLRGIDAIALAEERAGGAVIATGIERAIIAGLQGVDDLQCVALDTVRQFAGGTTNSDRVMTVATQGVTRIADALGCAAIVPHHTTKAGAREGQIDQYSGSGSGAFGDNLRVVLVVDALTVEQVKTEFHIEPADEVWLDVADYRLRVTDTRGSLTRKPVPPMLAIRCGFTFRSARSARAKDGREKAHDALVEVLKAIGAGHGSVKAIAKALGKGEGAVRPLVGTGETQGLVARTARTRGGHGALVLTASGARMSGQDAPKPSAPKEGA